MTIKRKLCLVIGLIVIALIAVYTAANYLVERHLLLQAIDQKLAGAVQHVQRNVPADYHDRIVNRESVSPEEFTRIVDENNKLCLDLGLQYVWSCLKVGNQIVFTSATSPNKDVRKRDHAAFFDVHKDPHAFDVVFETMKPDYSSFQNEWGRGRMVLVPGKDRFGREYCLGASISLEEVQAELRKSLQHSLYFGMGFLLIGMFVSLRVSGSLAKPIVELIKIADGIARGQMDQTIVTSGTSELVSLGNSLTVMKNSIRQKIGELETEVIERKQAQAMTAIYQQISQNARDPILLMEEDGRLFEVNYAAEALYGYSREELLQLSISDLRGHADLEVFSQQKEHAWTNGILIEAVHYRKDGTPAPVEVSSCRITFDGRGMFLSVVRDITQRKTEQHSLRKSEERMRHFFEHQTAGMAITTRDKKWLNINNKLCQILGYTREELEHITWEELTHPEDRADNSSLFNKLLTGEIQNTTFEKRYLRKDGVVIYALVSLACVQQENGGMDHAFLLLVDITERKLAEQSLQASEARIAKFNDLLQAAYKVLLLIQNERDAEKLLTGYCDILVKTQGYLGVWIGRPDPESNQVISVARTGNARKVLEEALITWDDTPHGQGPCGTAIRERVPVVFNNITTEPRFDLWRDQALAAGCASIATFPMIHDGQLWGVVTVKAGRINAFEQNGIELLSGLANEVAQALYYIQHRKALKRSEESLRLQSCALEAAANAIIITDRDGAIEWTNAAFTAMTGYSLAEAIGQNLRLLKSGKQDKAFYKNLWKTILAGEVWYGEIINRRKDGTLYPEEATITPIRDTGGSITHFISVKHDITERMRDKEALTHAYGNLENLVSERTSELEKEIAERWSAERALIQQREQLQRMLDTAPVGVAILVDGIIRFANPRITALANLKIGNTSSTFFINPADRENIIQMLESKKVVKDMEFKIYGPKGEVRHAMATFLSTEFEGEKGILCWIVDVEKLKVAEQTMRSAKEMAESASRAKTTFLANMSHEIRTPMNAILGFSQLMLHDSTLATQQRKHLETINRSGNHLLALINDILDMAKIEAGRVELNATVFDFSVLLHDLEAMFRIRADAKGLGLEFSQASEVPQYCVVDANKLMQVLINLLGNAVKMTDRGRVVLRVSCNKKARRLFFEVEDTGIGIPREAIEKLFRPFVQVHNEDQVGRGGGTGLGLAISSEIVRLMGGDISVTSKVGKGSIFSFFIPLIAGQIENMERVAHIQRVIGLKSGQPNYRVLIVDDTEDNRDLLAEMLSRTGFSTRLASSGKEALRLFNTWHPHLILMDMRMPTMGGVEAIQRIRARSGGQTVKIMCVTANTFESMRKDALEAGADDFLVKPFKEEVLFEKIRMLIGVEYVYDTENHEYLLPAAAAIPDFSPEELASLPMDLVEQIQKAAVNADYDLLMELTQSVESTSNKLSLGLCSLVESYNYQRLLDILNPKQNEE